MTIADLVEILNKPKKDKGYRSWPISPVLLAGFIEFCNASPDGSWLGTTNNTKLVI